MLGDKVGCQKIVKKDSVKKYCRKKNVAQHLKKICYNYFFQHENLLQFKLRNNVKKYKKDVKILNWT